jgi:hypothetical protein
MTRVGAHMSPRILHHLSSSVNYLELGAWMRAHGHDLTPRVEQREELFDMVGNQIGDREVLYMEFGVYQGESMRYWSKLLRNPQSKLHGFDSFEGLPEPWATRPKSHYSAGGQIPEIDDTRVRFFKGWFDRTLPNYEFPSYEELVVALDADLYSSTILVLNALESVIVPGTYLYFDEFNDRLNELRAFDEFLKRTGMKFSLVGASRLFQYSLFQRTS